MLCFARAAIAAAVLFATPAFAHDDATAIGSLEISASFARATLPNAPVGGGFMTIENHGEAADRLVSVTSPMAGDVQIHEMAMEGDVMRMRAVPDGLELPAGETVELKPGGYHLMFMGLKGAFVEGETVPVTLTFEHAGSVDLALPVLGTAADAASHGEHAHEAGH